MDKPKVTFRRRGHKIEVEDANGDVLAYCFIGDDTAVEQIADILSAKKLPNEAMKLRQMAIDARKPIRNLPTRMTGL